MTLRSILLISLYFQLFILINCAPRDSDRGRGKGTLNRLAEANSPYLREHADNPVDWYEWGDEALEKAKRENKPLIISIGYSSCHWCHVMEKESFMDTAVARLMNENFVSIKIDREERPDIDQIYLNAAQLISGNGGWPLNAFALPDGKPFFAATYFPKSQWIAILRQIVEAFRSEHDNVVKQAEALTKGIQAFDVIPIPERSSVNYSQKTYQEILAKWQSYLDYENGGLSGFPKFPMPGNWEFLLQYHYLTGNKKALEIVITTLDQMASGGIYDQLGGGFCRYSTDSKWKIPHFEKMLYDNAQLVSLYAHGYQETGNPLYAEVIDKTLAFIEREMTSPEGGFYSSLNADSEEEEGKFYVWTKSEIKDLLDKESADLFNEYYQITDSGNWENGKNILHKKFTEREFAARHQLTIEQWNNRLGEGEKILMNARNKRIRPSTDDKILTSWNALMLKGYIDAFFATGNRKYLETALKNGKFLEEKMIRKEGGLWRNYKNGKANIDAFLDDYALLAKAFIDLYQSTFDVRWLGQARALVDYAVVHFHDVQSGMFYYPSDQSENLIARKMELADNVIPSSNSVMADVLYRLGEYYNEKAYINLATSMLNGIAQSITTGPYYSNWATLMGLIAYEPYEVAIMGEQALEKSRELQSRYMPLGIFMGGIKEDLPLLENKHVEGQTVIYVCRNKICKLPVHDVPEAMRQIK